MVQNNSLPLVSIVVVTYNSSSTILETLDSIKAQTYRNIELIVSDDHSTDNTLLEVKKWLNDNSNRFVSTNLLETEVNTGVTKNCNRGLKASKGEWVKYIAGDDALLDDGIEKYVKFVKTNKDLEVCFAKSLVYKDFFLDEFQIKDNYSRYNVLRDNGKGVKDKFKRLCFGNCILGNSDFIKRSLLEELGGFDEDIPMCEDFPLWVKITSLNHNIYYLNDYTVKYRVHEGSIDSEYAKKFIFSKYFEADNIVYQKYIKQRANSLIRMAIRYNHYLRLFLSYLKMDRDRYGCKYFYRFMNSPIEILKIWYSYSL